MDLDETLRNKQNNRRSHKIWISKLNFKFVRQQKKNLSSVFYVLPKYFLINSIQNLENVKNIKYMYRRSTYTELIFSLPITYYETNITHVQIIKITECSEAL